jgi:hypothetical protein
MLRRGVSLWGREIDSQCWGCGEMSGAMVVVIVTLWGFCVLSVLYWFLLLPLEGGAASLAVPRPKYQQLY